MNQRVAEQSSEQLVTYLQHGNPAAGMPSFADLAADERATLARYLMRLNVETITKPVPPAGAAAPKTWGPPGKGDWRTYNGADSGNRYSPLEQITTANVSTLKLKWVFPLQYFGLETTPLAADGVLYVTGPNEVFALDALTGAAALALFAAAQHRDAGGCAARHQPRCRAARRQRVFRHRQCTPARARSRNRQVAVGRRDGTRDGAPAAMAVPLRRWS